MRIRWPDNGQPVLLQTQIGYLGKPAKVCDPLYEGGHSIPEHKASQMHASSSMLTLNLAPGATVQLERLQEAVVLCLSPALTLLSDGVRLTHLRQAEGRASAAEGASRGECTGSGGRQGTATARQAIPTSHLRQLWIGGEEKDSRLTQAPAQGTIQHPEPPPKRPMLYDLVPTLVDRVSDVAGLAPGCICLMSGPPLCAWCSGCAGTGISRGAGRLGRTLPEG